jgi:hypothetical protein
MKIKKKHEYKKYEQEQFHFSFNNLHKCTSSFKNRIQKKKNNTELTRTKIANIV